MFRNQVVATQPVIFPTLLPPCRQPGRLKGAGMLAERQLAAEGPDPMCTAQGLPPGPLPTCRRRAPGPWPPSSQGGTRGPPTPCSNPPRSRSRGGLAPLRPHSSRGTRWASIHACTCW